MTNRHAAEHLEQDYGRNLRLALIAALLLLIAGFHIVRMPEPRAFELRSVPLTVIDRPVIIDPNLSSPASRPRPSLAVAAADGGDIIVGRTVGDNIVPHPEPGTGELPVVGIDGVVEFRPRPVDLPLPVYPRLCRDAGIEGTAVLKLLVEPDSSVNRAELLRSSGNRLLDAAALEAAVRARFVPGRQGVLPVRVWVAVPYVFRIN